MLIQPYRTSWETDFRNIKTVLEAALQHVQVRIEHVGSTAVKNLAAKPVIDIDLIHEKGVPFETVKARLEKIGYFHNGDQGLEGREVFKRKKETGKHPVLDAIEHHLYVCEAGSRELERHLAFRNYLSANEKAREEYQRIKYAIAELAKQDKQTYGELKETLARDFIETVLAEAAK